MRARILEAAPAASSAAATTRAAGSSGAAILAAASSAAASSAAASLAVSSAPHAQQRLSPPGRLRQAIQRGLVLGLLLGACGEPRDLSTAQLARVVEAQQPSLKVCYDAALAQHPYRQEMRLEAVIDIAPSGLVTSVELEGGGGLPGMVACLRKAIARWEFPRAPDATHASLPLIFKPEVKPAGPTLDDVQQALKQAIGK
jgi:hypothetical protein